MRARRVEAEKQRLTISAPDLSPPSQINGAGPGPSEQQVARQGLLKPAAIGDCDCARLITVIGIHIVQS